MPAPVSGFAEELLAWGPDVERPSATLEEAHAYCRHLATSHYENFPVTSWILPRRLHQPFFNIYAYCRWSDDLSDEVQDTTRSLELLAWWRQQLHDCYAGRAWHPVFVALMPTIREFQIPMDPFEDLLSAFVQDQKVHEYETFEQLLDYCRRSANPVGRLVLYLCGKCRPEHFRWSDSICTGLQLTNFWQDVNRDLDIPRIYLPREDRARFGYRDEDLQQRITNPAFLELMKFQVERARPYLRPWRATTGADGTPIMADGVSAEAQDSVRSIPFRLQVVIELFARGGLRILDKIEAIEYRVWDQRPVLKKFDFVGLILGVLWHAASRPFRWSRRNRLK